MGYNSKWTTINGGSAAITLAQLQAGDDTIDGITSGTPIAIWVGITTPSGGSSSATITGITINHFSHTFYVANAGNDNNSGITPTTPFATIGHAIIAASSGDTIDVAAGAYNEAVNVDKSLIIDGAQAGVDARTRSATSESIVQAQTGGPSNSAFSIEANGVTIDGFEIDGTGTSEQQTWGINADAGTNTSNIHITNTIFKNLYEGLHVQGPYSKVCSNIIVDQNLFYDTADDPFQQDAGIWMASAQSNSLTIENNDFYGHDYSDTLGDYAAINIDSCTGLTIKGNDSHDDGTFLVLVTSSNVLIENNTSKNQLGVCLTNP